MGRTGRQELGRIGGRSPAGSALTASELAVAELASAGRSNREIAAELVVSIRTVESQLSAAYRKLDIQSRGQLAAALAASARARPPPRAPACASKFRGSTDATEGTRPYGAVVANETRRFFLVERYIPSISSSSVESAAQRLAATTDDSAHHLITLLVAGEETCLSVFEAADVRAVEVANQRAGFDLDRIVEVEMFRRRPPPGEVTQE